MAGPAQGHKDGGSLLLSPFAKGVARFAVFCAPSTTKSGFF